MSFFPRFIAPVLLAMAATASLAQSGSSLDTAAIEQITGLKGTFSKEENVFKVTKPRTDIKVQIDHWPAPPFMGLTSWAAFTPASGSNVMVMGDIVLFEDEVNPVMSAALDAGLDVTALHNHFFFDRPKVYFMHIGGTGPVDQIAAGVKQVLAAVTDIRAATPAPAAEFPGQIAGKNAITAEPIEAVFGVKGQADEGMYKVVIGRVATMHGVKIGNQMGVNTWAAFAGSDDQAVVDGDFVMTEDELQPVLKTMRAGGINIVAIHQHMTHEQPRYLFLHYWGKGRAADLAKVVKQALDVQQK